MKNTINGINSALAMRELNALEGRAIETIQNEAQKEY